MGAARGSLAALAVLVVALGAGCGHGTAAGGRDGGVTADGGAVTDAGVPDGGAPDAGPWVHFVSPAPGATVPNPVTFTVAAGNVDQVQILADGTWPLSPPWDPATRATLRYRFVNTGTRSLQVNGLVGGRVVATEPLTITIPPDPCADRFFLDRFDAQNQDPGGTVDLASLREDALAAVKQAIEGLRACGATVTDGGMMSLLYYEGGLRLGAYNTLCSENSYDPMPSGCDAWPEALYSYQYGLGAIHTSNFHPCKGGSWTAGMRALFLKLAADHGYDTSASLLTPALTDRFHQVCPGATPTAVDYYLLAAHDVFGIPRNASGNDLAAVGTYPFVDPAISVALTFHALTASCAAIHSDRDAITVFGGGDSSYADPAKQDQILSYYQDFAAASCP
jgi:hypothetical protein